jgi:hypothetical protein
MSERAGGMHCTKLAADDEEREYKRQRKIEERNKKGITCRIGGNER